MRPIIRASIVRHLLTGLAAAAAVVAHGGASAGLVRLANAPLASAAAADVKPNLMFILDTSGSMDFDYMPDWVGLTRVCKAGPGDYSALCAGHPLFKSPDINGVYYNPAIRYSPPVNADGSPWEDQAASKVTAVKDDAYGIQSQSATNLVNTLPDLEWCTDATRQDCLRNDNYLLPGRVAGKDYVVPHETQAKHTGKVATGSVAEPRIESRAFGPHYYLVTAGEFCDSPDLTNCVDRPTGKFVHPARIRWCKDATLTNCQAARVASGANQFTHPRYPTKARAAAGVLTVYKAASSSWYASRGDTVVRSVDAGSGRQLMSRPVQRGGDPEALANEIAASINACTAAATGNCTTAGFSATVRSSGGGSWYVTVSAPFEAGDVRWAVAVGIDYGNLIVSWQNFSGYIAAVPGQFRRIDIVPGATYPRAPSRTDCTSLANACSYAEEIGNFANWWTYYRTRMQTMKTAVSQAFRSIDERYRIGFIDIYGGSYRKIQPFTGGRGQAKEEWYATLFNAKPTGGTPLRSALARVGRLYAGMRPDGLYDSRSKSYAKIADDPVEHACQQNFALLTTDGFWNGDRDKDILNIRGDAPVGNLDGDAGTRPMYEGPTATANTLADVAKYYHDNDLRTAALGNCTGALGTDVCGEADGADDAGRFARQRMSTFTLGLGVNGVLGYSSDYKNALPGSDFYNITHGTGSNPNWPVPVADTESAVDDLWHAAVNGNGTYFSTKDPTSLAGSLSTALTEIGAKVGAGSAAATSTLNPVAGDNFAYVASYTSVKWTGNLEARSIDLGTGEVNRSAIWSVENVYGESCPSPGRVVSEESDSGSYTWCVRPITDKDTCAPSATQEAVNGMCRSRMTIARKGTMTELVGRHSDKRTILMNGDGRLVPFNWSNVKAAGLGGNFEASFLGGRLSQWSQLDPKQQAVASGANLIDYLRGQTGYEDRSSNVTHGNDNRVFRYREATMGDPTESRPAFVGRPAFEYLDSGYAAFASSQAGRTRAVFIGANDGMLHAFNATTGVEMWAYVPSMVIPRLWQLADRNYASRHANFVNGSPVVGDVFAGGSWRTILVAGLNGGGRGYYALDVTNPAAPQLLWEIDALRTSNPVLKNLGYTFAPPVFTKKADGTWVVLVTSGYNNVDPGDGVGRLFILDPMSGNLLGSISTGAGDGTSPSGLGRLGNWLDDPMRNNTSVAAYAGDLAGNVWRFDINAGSATKFAELRDPAGRPQPVTSRPELGNVNGRKTVFIATGKYLEASDLGDNQVQTVYAIREDGGPALVNPRTSSDMARQTIVGGSRSGTRSATAGDIDIGKTHRGWYADLPESKERNHVDPLLDSGLLIVPSTVPDGSACSPSGHGWLNYFNYQTGTTPDKVVSQRFDAPVAGFNVYYTPDGNRHVVVVTFETPTPTAPRERIHGGDEAKGFVGKRVIWREMTPQ